MTEQKKQRVVCIHDGRLEMLVDGEKIWQQKITDFLQYSFTRPWSLPAHTWKKEKEFLSESVFRFVYLERQIRAEIKLMQIREDVWQMDVAYTNISEQTLRDFTCGVLLSRTGETGNKVTIPHIIYNDNPGADPERIVPHIGKTTGGGILVEEHRLPIPGVNVEWQMENAYYDITLLAKPEVITGDESEYWSLGVIREENGESIAALSGPLMFNGMKDVVYGGRCTPLPWLKGYRYLAPGQRIAKSFWLSFGKTQQGRGFRSLVRLGYALLKPVTEERHTLPEMIALKDNVLNSRYYKDDVCCGYLTFGAANRFGNVSGRPEYFLYGWTGQAIKLAWCDIRLGLMSGNEERIQRGLDIVRFFVENGENRQTPGLFYGYYLIDAGQWRNSWSDPQAPFLSRIEGESMVDLIDVMQLLSDHGRKAPSLWEEGVRRACCFLTSAQALTERGIYPLSWNEDGTPASQKTCAAGLSCVWALAKAAKYFSEESYLQSAIRLYEAYYELNMKTFDLPFSHATLDAACEDKEAGIYAFTAAAELYALTGEERFREWACVAGDWILTFVYFWETGFQRGTACDAMDFHTTGWPGVSVQNHHLDVFFPSYEMYAFGKAAGEPFYEEMGEHVRRAFTYGVCEKEGDMGFSVVGEQGEQYYQTNYFQVRYPAILKHTGNYRGGMQVWNPSWITAQVLQNSLRCYCGDGTDSAQETEG